MRLREWLVALLVAGIAGCGGPEPSLPPATDGGGDDSAKPDPCAGVVCGSPPASSCIDTMTLRSYRSPGVCGNGQCSYARSDTLCANGCSNGACLGNDPCRGIICNSPPAPTCLNGTTLRWWMGGTCSGGMCSYASTTTPCANGCQAGMCLGDPCAGVTCIQPPAPSCVNAATLRSYAPMGTCNGGACSYAPIDMACANGCQAGACNGNPCMGVVCNQPPSQTCLNGSTLRSYAPMGSCSGGTCSYSSTDTPCANGCQAGACNGDPCMGVVCNQPPAAACLNPTTLRSYPSMGVCSGGSCTYAPIDTACPAPANSSPVCNAAACGFTCDQGYASNGTACVRTGYWTAIKDIPSPRYRHAVAAGADGRIYAIGGDDNLGNYLASVWAYTPATDSWAPAASMSIPRFDLAAVAAPDGRIYAIGGGNSSVVWTATVEAYTPATDSWTPVASMTQPRRTLAAVVGANGHIYALGGQNSNSTISAVEEYDPAMNTWTAVASMAQRRQEFGAALGTDGRIYAIDGIGLFGSVEAYTPATNSWAPVASLPTDRRDLAAVAGPDGRVYALGGYTQIELPTVEAYTPATDSWAPVVSMMYGRSLFGAATGSDGRIYAISGWQDGLQGGLGACEAYTP
jgi:N-acetylneuraminic acid mutarotase